MPDLIYSATHWPTNSAMILDVHRLGYLKDTDWILDPTYGRGGWWRLWRPQQLVAETHKDGWDFRAMWYGDEAFDAVAFDPPYVSGGGVNTGIPAMHDAYDMNHFTGTKTSMSSQECQDNIDLGMAECFRVVKPGGIVLVKCQSYVNAGKLFPGLFNTYNAAIALGYKVEDHLNFLGGARPQPLDRAQKHSRRNQSDLLVLRRPKRKAR